MHIAQESIDYLNSVKDMVNEILSDKEQLKKIDNSFTSDIRCLDTKFYLDSYGESGLIVVIYNCSPNAEKLKEYVRDELLKNAIKADEVITEW